jgi:ABC-type multidrug transport system fused ATPase/permease subunit
MDKGKIKERGTHDELLKQNGIYRKIYDLQINAGMTPEEEMAYEA